MPNQTTKPYEQVLVAIADIAPDSPDMPWVTTKQPSPARTPMFAAATAFAAVLLIIGVTTLALTWGGTGEAPVSVQAPAASTQATPLTTVGPPDDLFDPDVVMIWQDAVDEVLIEAGWSDWGLLASSTITPLADGGSVTANVLSTNGELLLVVTFQGFGPGEYSTDPSWQQKFAGSDEPGEVTDEGTFFVPSTEFPRIVVITEKGALTIEGEQTALANAPVDRKLVEAMAVSLIPYITIITEKEVDQANVPTTTVVSDPTAGFAPLSALPKLGFVSPEWIPLAAQESDSRDRGGFRQVHYNVVDQETGSTKVGVGLVVRGIQEGSIHETTKWWAYRTDYETITMREHDARLFVGDGTLEIVWRDSDDAVVTMSIYARAANVDLLSYLPTVTGAITELTDTQWADMLLLDGGTATTIPPTTLANN